MTRWLCLGEQRIRQALSADLREAISAPNMGINVPYLGMAVKALRQASGEVDIEEEPCIASS